MWHPRVVTGFMYHCNTNPVTSALDLGPHLSCECHEGCAGTEGGEVAAGNVTAELLAEAHVEGCFALSFCLANTLNSILKVQPGINLCMGSKGCLGDQAGYQRSASSLCRSAAICLCPLVLEEPVFIPRSEK